MEFSFELLVLAALAGMVIKIFAGWVPWKLAGFLGPSFTLILALPIAWPRLRE